MSIAFHHHALRRALQIVDVQGVQDGGKRKTDLAKMITKKQ
jgi:hypothetical protein